MRALIVATAALLASAIGAAAEGPAAGPSSQGGEPAKVAPAGVEQTLPADRPKDDPSEKGQPSSEAKPQPEVPAKPPE